MYHQTYDPLGNVFLSTIVAAIPILTLLYFIALHRYKDAQGNVHLGISAPWAAFFGVIAAFLVVVPGVPHAGHVGGLGLRARHALGLPRDHLDRARGDVPLHDERGHAASSRSSRNRSSTSRSTGGCNAC